MPIVTFTWQRNRLFDEQSCQAIFDIVSEAKMATVTAVDNAERVRYRPTPLNTVEAQKLINRKLRYSPAVAMKHMEKLYNLGYLSYPRTETTRYNPTINLFEIVANLKSNKEFGGYAARILSKELWAGPRNGKHDDKAHPPIHPVKNAVKAKLTDDEWKVYDILTRHFLASISKDAELFETTVTVEMSDEVFHAKGTSVKALNWLEVFPWEKQVENELPPFEIG